MRTSRIRATAAALTLSALIPFTVGCTTTGGDTDDTITIGITPDQLAASYDVRPMRLNAFDSRGVYDSLFLHNPETAGYDPSLATSYTRSEDWKEVTITLRDDVSFTDGETLTAHGIKDYLELMGRSENWWLYGQWTAIQPTIETSDATTLILTSDTPFEEYYGFLLNLFTGVAIPSPAALEDLEELAREPVGSGPYLLESVTAEVGATLVRNDDYWNPEAYPFDQVELKVFADETAALNALKSGQIDATKLSTALAIEAEESGFRLNEGVGRYTAIYVADREGTVVPALADQRVRQAMALAFDREGINENLNLSRGKVTSQPFTPAFPDYVEGGDDRYGYDLERARSLMAEAGYADGFELVLPSTPFLGIDNWSAVVQQSLGDIGIEVSIDEFPSAGDYFNAVLAAKYPVFFYSELYIQSLPVFITSDAILNVFRVDDPIVNRLWAEMNNGPDDVAREAGAELGEYVLDQAILVPFASPNFYWASNQDLVVQVGQLGGFPAIIHFRPAP